MKSRILKIAFVMTVAVVGGINVFNSQKPETLSDTVLANVEALADNETSSSCTEVCYPHDGWMCTRISGGVTSRCVNYRKI